MRDRTIFRRPYSVAIDKIDTSYRYNLYSYVAARRYWSRRETFMYICTQVITTTRTNAFCSGENEAVEKTGYSGKSIDIDRIEDSVYNITRTMETPAIKRLSWFLPLSSSKSTRLSWRLPFSSSSNATWLPSLTSSAFVSDTWTKRSYYYLFIYE